MMESADIFLWTGFMIGFVGSLHCLGMCGPIVLALPGKQEHGLKRLAGRLLYSLGRIVTYSLLGMVMGLLGEMISLGSYQRPASIILGLLILLGVLLPTKTMRQIFPLQAYAGLTGRVKSWWGTLFRRNSLSALWIIGLLNGFLPCGLVYVALAGSLATGGLISGISYMLLFGLGTIPALFAMSLVGDAIGVNARRYLNRLLPLGAALLAVLMIFRGLGLGIPLLSPPADLSSKTRMHGHPGSQETDTNGSKP